VNASSNMSGSTVSMVVRYP